MHKLPKLSVAVVLCVLLFASVVSAASVKELIEVYRNQATFKVDGRTVAVEHFVHKDTPYIPVTALADPFGVNVQWTAATKTATVSTVKATKLSGTVDATAPRISLKSIGLQADQIDAMELELNGKTIYKRFEITGEELKILDDSLPAGANILELGKTYTLKLFAVSGARHRLSFAASDLPDLTDNGVRRVIYVPAMPELGFHWPYFLALPSIDHKAANQGARRYLMVDTTNTGTTLNTADLLNRARSEIVNRSQLSMSLAEELWAPMLYPAFPRPDVGYFHENEFNLFYTHALDRDTATLHLKMKDANLARTLTDAFQRTGFDVKTMVSLDLQLNAMIDHAIAYLNKYGHKVQPTKVMLAGYSASGDFTDRYAALHPDRVKAVATGSTLDDMILPLAEYKGQKLIFPIGTSDYKEITGRAFDLKKHNQVARLVYSGEQDTNNVVPASDCYGDKERKVITSLWGTPVLARAQKLVTLYGESGGKGIFIFDKGVEHGMSSEMVKYIKTFLAANRDSDAPVYPTPANPAQLKYTLFK